MFKRDSKSAYENLDNSNELADNSLELSPHSDYCLAAKGESSANNSNNELKWVKQMKKRLKGFVSISNTLAAADPNTSPGNVSSNMLDNTDNSLPLMQAHSNVHRNFAVPLNQCEPSSISPFIPVVIEICTRLVEIHINDEGIYRKVGQKQVVVSLRKQLQHGVLTIDQNDEHWNNPHVIVSLLKCFLNELPDSLITSHLYSDFIKACRGENHQQRLTSIKKLLNKLPKHNYETLKYLCTHLRRVAASYKHNKMTIKNLCIAFSQSIIRHNEANSETIKTDHLHQSLLVEILLIYYDWLFDESSGLQTMPCEMKDSVEQNLFQQYCCNKHQTVNYRDVLARITSHLKVKNYDDVHLLKMDEWQQLNSLIENKSQNWNENQKNTLKSTKSMINITKANKTPTCDDPSHRPVNANTTRKHPEAQLPAVSSRSKSVEQCAANINPNSSLNLNLKANINTSDRFVRNTRHRKSLQVCSCIPHKQFVHDDFFMAKRDTGAPINTSKCAHSRTVHSNAVKSAPLVRKTYDSLLKKMHTPPTANRPNINTNRSIDFKSLEKKNQQERERLHAIMKKLEIDLINAKIDLIQEDFLNDQHNMVKLDEKKISHHDDDDDGENNGTKQETGVKHLFTPSLDDLIASFNQSRQVYSSTSHQVQKSATINRRHTFNSGQSKWKQVQTNTKQGPTRKISKSASYLGKVELKISSKKSTTHVYYRDEHSLRRTFLNLSPLSISESSVTSSSSQSNNSNLSLIYHESHHAAQQSNVKRDKSSHVTSIIVDKAQNLINLNECK